MKYLIENIRLPLDYNEREIIQSALNKAEISNNDILSYTIVKQSIDARRKNCITFVFSVLIETDEKLKIKNNADIKEYCLSKREISCGKEKLNHRPVIIGCGPAGMFAALILARYGFKPLLFERGKKVEERQKIIERYWNVGEIDPETNIQFGEGGAGTFSDGKLVTRINDERCEEVLNEFFEAGAPAEIMYKSKPHIGSDNLKKIIPNITQKIYSLGGEVIFNTKLTDINIENNKIKSVYIRRFSKSSW